MPLGGGGLVCVVGFISVVLGVGVKRISEGERAAMKKLRRVPGDLTEQVDPVAVS